MFLIAIVLYGLAAATFGRWLAPASGPGGWRVSLLVGVAGSFLGALVGQWLARPAPVGYVLSLLGAVAFVAFHHTMTSSRPGWA